MSFRVEKNVMVPMRDGVTLATDLWIPDDRPAPVLLVRLPYGKDLFPGEFSYPVMPNIFSLLEAGYAVAWQDCRGVFGSGGQFQPLLQEPEDGADTVAWLCEQQWCDGNVGTYGHSYLGVVQWATASQAPPGLRAIAPSISSTDWYAAPWHSDGGALSWHSLWSFVTLMTMLAPQPKDGADAADVVGEAAGMFDDLRPHLERLPLSDQQLLVTQWDWFAEGLRHPDRDDFWQQVSVYDRIEEIEVPALHIGGWFDPFVGNMARSFARMRAQAGSVAAREQQRLIIGPWDHLTFGGVYHDRQFGLAADVAAVDLTADYIEFFDRHLRGRTAAPQGRAPVRIFVMGVDEWRDEQDWPLPDTVYIDYYLDSGQADRASEGGALTTQVPTVDGVATYTYDPADPVPTAGGRILLPAALNATGPVDQRAVEARDDVLCFTTAELEEPVEVTGHVSLVLHVASSARDTDFTGKLVDVFPDGHAVYLTDGILRARYRNSLSEPELLEPGHTYELTVDMSVTSNVFLPGHRIRLEVSSSNFPRFDRNTNTGGVVAEDTDSDLVVATNEVFHGPHRPSRLVLPVIRR
ncbi:CocE/NonD family hydrolase [Streptomyces qaidamensis]|uniref:CocE/NonD family hydrolase n=1 Tax=Streptomyces qaidamensis TaxID=1783515 RepID=UPI00365CBD4F